MSKVADPAILIKGGSTIMVTYLQNRFETPWETLCIDLIGPYTLKGKDGTIIDFMFHTMINPASSWFKIVKLPVEILPPASSEEDKWIQRGIKRLRMNILTSPH